MCCFLPPPALSGSGYVGRKLTASLSAWHTGSPKCLLAVILPLTYRFFSIVEETHIAPNTNRDGQNFCLNLQLWATHNDVRQPFIPSDRTQSYHMYYLLLPGLTQRQAFIARLKDQEILSVFHYLPLHLSDMGMRFGGKPGDCPVTERISDQLVRLPFFYNLTDEEQDRVIEAIISQPV